MRFSSRVFLVTVVSFSFPGDGHGLPPDATALILNRTNRRNGSILCAIEPAPVAPSQRNPLRLSAHRQGPVAGAAQGGYAQAGLVHGVARRLTGLARAARASLGATPVPQSIC